MSKYTLNKHLLEGLSKFADKKNEISPFSSLLERELKADEIKHLTNMGVLNEEGLVSQDFSTIMTCISQPHAVVKLQFTGGVGLYQHNIYYNQTYDNSVSITLLSDEAILTDEVDRSEEHTSELQSRPHLVCRLLLEKKKLLIQYRPP